MKKINWYLLALSFALMPALQACDDSDGYSIGDLGGDWATIRTTGGGGYFLEGDTWGTIWPAATEIPWFQPVDGERAIALFNPLYDNFQGYDIAVDMEGLLTILTKDVEDLTAENEKELGDDEIVIYDGDMWLGGKYLNLIFQQQIPMSNKHRISLVKNTTKTYDDDGYVHLELRYNTYNDKTDYWQASPVSYNLSKFYPSPDNGNKEIKGFKVMINSAENGKKEITLDLSKTSASHRTTKDIKKCAAYLK